MTTITPDTPAPDTAGAEFTTGSGRTSRPRPPAGAKPPVGTAGPDARTVKQLQLDATQQRQRQQGADEAAAAASATEDPELAGVQPSVREDVESIEVELPDGRQVLYAPPRALSFRMSELLGAKANDAYLQAMVRTTLGVRLLGGKQVRKVDSLNDCRQIAAELTDDGMDALYMLHQITWPPVTIASLKVLKKNLRG